MKSTRAAKQVGAGAVAGTLATLPMSAFMLLAQRAGWLAEQAPERITELSIERATKKDAEGESLDAWTALAHLAFGAVAGATFSALRIGHRVRPAAAIPLGALFGTFVWLISYWSVLPTLDLMPPPAKDQRRRPEVMLIAHWIFGGVLGLLFARRPTTR